LVTYPEAPVVAGALDKCLWPALDHDTVQIACRLIFVGRAEPVVAVSLLANRNLAKREPDAAINRSLCDWVAFERTVFGVAPGALLPIELLIASSPGIHTHLAVIRILVGARVGITNT